MRVISPTSPAPTLNSTGRLSHRLLAQGDPAKLERLHKLNEFHFQQFAHLVTKLAATPEREGDGTMLVHTVLLYGTGISDRHQ